MRNIGLLILLLLVFSCSKHEARLKNFNSTVGFYKLDLKRTMLGEYSKDSLFYKNLKVEFRNDSIFKFNMSVPFILEESGKWLADGGDFESWNWLRYKSWLNSEDITIGNGNQFTCPYFDKNDSILMINAATSKDNKASIQEIYFIKIK